jgi:hypothetical protein
MSALTTSHYHGSTVSVSSLACYQHVAFRLWSTAARGVQHLSNDTWHFGGGSPGRVAAFQTDLGTINFGCAYRPLRCRSLIAGTNYMLFVNPLHESGVAFVKHRVHISGHLISWVCVSGPRRGASGMPGHAGRWRKMSQLHLEPRYIDLGKCVQ